MHYTVRHIGNPINESERKYYAIPQVSGVVETRDFAKRVAEKYSMSTPVILAVIEAVSQALPEFLMLGNSVRIGNLGIFRLGFRSKGHSSSRAIRTSDIYDIRILYRSSSEINQEIRDNITFTKCDIDI